MTVDINKCSKCGHITTLIDPDESDVLTVRMVMEMLSKLRSRLRLGGLLMILPYITLRIAYLLTPTPGPEGNPLWVPILWSVMLLAMLVGGAILVFTYVGLSSFVSLMSLIKK